jgi:glycosyltransferase involved in cell wall biosynthesis
MSLRILVLSFYYPPDLCPGSFRCAAFIEELQNKLPPSTQIELVTTMPNRYATFTMQAKKFEQIANLTIHRIALPPHQSGMVAQAKAFLSFAKSALKIVRKNKYDLIFATSSRLMTASLGAWISRRLKAPLYLDIRDLFVDTITDVLPKKLAFIIKPFLSALEKWTFRQAKRINLVSKGFESYFSERYPHIQPSWFSNGVDIEFTAACLNVNVPLQPPEYITVLYVGNIGEGQGLHHIIPRMAKRLEGKVRFKIIGDGGRKIALKEALSDAGCQNVELVAPLNRSQLLDVYQQADVLFLHLNDHAAFQRVLPSKLFEYAATGKPILAGVSGYAASFVEEEIHNAVIFQPCDVEAAVHAFSTLSLTSSNRQSFVEKFARKTIMQAMINDVCELA